MKNLEIEDSQHRLVLTFKKKEGYVLQVFEKDFRLYTDKNISVGSETTYSDIQLENEFPYFPKYEVSASMENIESCLNRMWLIPDDRDEFLSKAITRLGVNSLPKNLAEFYAGF